MRSIYAQCRERRNTKDKTKEKEKKATAIAVTRVFSSIFAIIATRRGHHHAHFAVVYVYITTTVLVPPRGRASRLLPAENSDVVRGIHARTLLDYGRRTACTCTRAHDIVNREKTAYDECTYRFPRAGNRVARRRRRPSENVRF